MTANGDSEFKSFNKFSDSLQKSKFVVKFVKINE